MPKDLYKLAITSAPTMEIARQIGTMLVKKQIAACVNVLPGVESIYEWKGEMKRDNECVLLIKTTTANVAMVEAELQEMHPYEIPEFIVLPIEGGSSAYLAWISAVTIDG